MENFVKVASASDLPVGEIMVVDIGDERILLSNIEGEFYAINEACSHARGPLADGPVDGAEVECPWHGSRFSLKTGEATNSPAVKSVPCYAVRVDGDDVLVGPPLG
ncbi:MAG: non-heme iron oxygenase ferredoxin subunit [Chloroflexi bacterium]|nr:non-heme iron oxygenase ferredoxin subunit [Chloroflexota bacterium]